MASSKNRSRKSARRKNSVSKPKKKTVSDAPELASVAEEDTSTTSHESPTGTGAMVKMRGLISGAEPVKEGFFSRRRTLGEWLLWLGGGTGLYYAYRFFMGGE